jgi:hypothetical protein
LHVKRLAAALGLLSACSRAPSTDVPDGCSAEIRLRIPEAVRNRVDLLVVLSNGTPYAREKVLPILQLFDDLAKAGEPIDLHLGIVTTDYGAGATGAPGCLPSPGGQQGRLQGVGAGAPMTCRAPIGANYVHYDWAGPEDANLPPGQDLLTTFSCMTDVGAGGCGFEHSLEAAYAALHNGIPENAGFLRDEALLAVVFASDRDDCSAPPDSDLFDKTTIEYGYMSHFRCLRYGLLCGDPPAPPPYGDSMGPLAGCKPAPNPGGAGPGKLYDIGRYVDLFTRPAIQGGVKADPNDVVLLGIGGPAEPLQVILSNPGTPETTPYAPCSPLNEAGNPPCTPVVQYSCSGPPAAEPAVRLATVIRAARNHGFASYCDGSAIDALAPLLSPIQGQLGFGCLLGTLPDPAHPDCAVEEVTYHRDGTTSVQAVTPCGPAVPCWRVDPHPACAQASPQSLRMAIDRDGQSPPDHSEIRVACAVTCG